jgi:hypothetical protein
VLLVKDGTISVGEFETVMRGLGQHLTKEQLAEMIAEARCLACLSSSTLPLSLIFYID